MKIIVFMSIWVLCACVPSRPSGPGGAVSVQTNSAGLLVTDPAGTRVYRLQAVTPRSLRLSVAEAVERLPADGGTFIAPDLAVPAWGVRQEGRVLAVTNAGGSLAIALDDLGVTLADRHGKLLYGPLSITRTNGGHTLLEAGRPADERVYGIGNGTLVKTAAESGVFNTTTRVPLIWTSSGYGVLVRHERPKVAWERKAKDRWVIPDSGCDVFFFTGDTAYDLLDACGELTGRPPVPPRWTFGYLQSRWGFRDFSEVRAHWRLFREKRIPVDAFIYDYDWYVDDWAWNRAVFPDPAANLAEARALGIRSVAIRKPRLTGDNIAYAEKNGWIAKDPPARRGAHLDFTRAEARNWWWERHAGILGAGIDGWWNDEAERILTEYYWMTKAQVDGQARTKPGIRCWTINRAFSPGLQRLGAAVWTGDISSSWGELKRTPQTLLSWSLCGMPYVCSDTGGFRGTPDPELYVRWQQQSALTPLMRAHGEKDSPRWPWAFGEAAEQAVRKAIELRYRLLPYLYSLAHEAFRTSRPLMRPLFLEFPDDPAGWNLDDQWLLGPSLLAAPFFASGGSRQVYLPEGGWYRFGGGPPLAGRQTMAVRLPLDEMPLYVRGGSIIPLAPVMQHSGERPPDELRIEVYPGRDAAFVLHEDDGTSEAYRQGKAAATRFAWSERERTLAIGKTIGDYDGQPVLRSYLVCIYGQPGPDRVSINGASVKEMGLHEDGVPGWKYDRISGCIIVSTGRIECAAQEFLLRLGN